MGTSKRGPAACGHPDCPVCVGSRTAASEEIDKHPQLAQAQYSLNQQLAERWSVLPPILACMTLWTI